MNIDFDIEDFLNHFSLQCKLAQRKYFRKNQEITSFIQKRNQICILLSGEADLVRYDLNGGKSIIEHYTEHDIFGEAFYTISVNNELSVEAKKNCEVLFYSYGNLFSKCKEQCEFHHTLLENILKITVDKASKLTTRIEVLTKRSTREKLLDYFSILSTRSLSKTIVIPFSLTDLADYLSVDRSAMMREIKILKDEGFIEKVKNKITLLY